MSRVAAIGERERVRGFALAGVRAVAAEDAAAVNAAARALDPDVALVILTPAARAALAAEILDESGDRLWVTMPD